MILTLHTWGQEMRTHVHIHAIVTAGGIPVRKRKSSRALEVTTTSTDEPPPQWIPIAADAPAFQPRQLADCFRDLLLAGIVELYRDGLLDLDSVPNMRGIESEDALARWLRPLAERPWVADSKITPEHLQGKDSASRYVSGYMTGTAINNARIRADDGINVTIDVWDYRTDKWTTETMPGAEFVRRFMLHIVPPTIHRVRYAGCFNARSRKTRLDSIRSMICEHNRERSIDSAHAKRRARRLALGETESEDVQTDRLMRTPTCLKCGTLGMKSQGHRNRKETLAYVAKLKYFIAFYAVCLTTLDHLMKRDWRDAMKERLNLPPTFNDWLSRVRFEQSHCVFEVRAHGDALDFGALGCSQTTLSSSSLPLPDI